jgi:hypothetical protein
LFIQQYNENDDDLKIVKICWTERQSERAVMTLRTQNRTLNSLLSLCLIRKCI